MADVLKKGSKGDAVKVLQGDLAALGYKVSVDGDFGPGTEDAVRHLQKSFGYTVDGIVGDGTLFLINQQKGLGWNSSASADASDDVSKGDSKGGTKNIK